MQKKLIVGLLFLLPLLIEPRFDISIPVIPFVQLALFCVAIILILAIRIKVPLTIRLFYIWCIITTLTSVNPFLSLPPLYMTTIFLLLFRVMLSLKKSDLRTCFMVISWACYIQLFWVILQILRMDFFLNVHGYGRLVGTMGNENPLAALFLLCVVPMYCYRKWSVIFPIIGMFLACSGASIYALLGGVFFYIIFSKPTHQIRKLSFVLLLVILCLIFVDQPITWQEGGRLELWSKIIEWRLDNRLLIGSGFSTFKVEFPKIYPTIYGHILFSRAHNTYLQAFAEQGLIGMISVILIPLAFFLDFLRRKTKTSLIWMTAIVMASINMFGNFAFRNFGTAFYILFLFACYKVEVSDEEVASHTRISVET